MNGTTRRYRLPPKFYWDHVARDCASGTVVSQNKRSVVVDLDQEAYDDLRSDASYYSDGATAAQMGEPGLAASARATLRVLGHGPIAKASR